MDEAFFLLTSEADLRRAYSVEADMSLVLFKDWDEGRVVYDGDLSKSEVGIIGQKLNAQIYFTSGFMHVVISLICRRILAKILDIHSGETVNLKWQLLTEGNPGVVNLVVPDLG